MTNCKANLLIMKPTDFSIFLSNLPLFSKITSDHINNIKGLFCFQECKKGEVVFKEEQNSSKMFFVLHGQFKIFKTSPNGKEQILHIMKSGDILAEAAMFEGKAYPANCAAIQDGALLSIVRHDFVNLIKTEPQIALNLLAIQAKRLRTLTKQIENLSLNETSQKLKNYLLENSTNNIFNMTISMSELASLLGVTRENVSRTFSQLIKQGFIEEKSKKQFVINQLKLKALTT